MWILNYVTKNSIPGVSPEKGSVKSSSNGKIHVDASSDYSAIPIVAPYGITYASAPGEESVVIKANGTDVCLGTVAKKNNLLPGELMLCSKGGASIVLKNDGGVYINGERF